jgi:hypothetical protein
MRLEQQAEAQASRASFVREELELIGQKRPVLSQLIVRPLPLIVRHHPSARIDVHRTERSSDKIVDLGLGTGFKKYRE